jgi:hypothetical protein
MAATEMMKSVIVWPHEVRKTRQGTLAVSAVLELRIVGQRDECRKRPRTVLSKSAASRLFFLLDVPCDDGILLRQKRNQNPGDRKRDEDLEHKDPGSDEARDLCHGQLHDDQQEKSCRSSLDSKSRGAGGFLNHLNVHPQEPLLVAYWPFCP